MVEACPHQPNVLECYVCTPVLRPRWVRPRRGGSVRTEVEDPIVQYIRKVTDAEVRGPSGGSPDLGELGALAPALAEFLTAAKWDDGSPRQVGTAMLLVDGVVWKCWVHDRDGRRSCFVSSRTPLELLSSVEDVLANGGGDWRPDDRRVQRGGK